MTKKQKIWTVVVIAVVLIIVSVVAFLKSNPGIYLPYKCDQGGDSTKKFYDPNWQARGAVCDGYYIPLFSKLQGQDKVKVLEKMASYLGGTKPTNSKDMRALAEKAADYLKSQTV